MNTAVVPEGRIEWATRSRPFPGETVCGDAGLVAPFEGGVLLAVIDGLGHGDEAATASRAALSVLAEQPGRPVLELIQTCHGALKRTRGAVLSLASINYGSGQVAWAGVGNVEAVIFRGGRAEHRSQVVPCSGVVGYQLPPLRATAAPIGPRDVLVMATDGLRHDFMQDTPGDGDLGTYAERLLSGHSRTQDDALVLALRYLRAPS